MLVRSKSSPKVGGGLCPITEREREGVGGFYSLILRVKKKKKIVQKTKAVLCHRNIWVVVQSRGDQNGMRKDNWK